MKKLFDDILLECAKNNYNRGKLYQMKEEVEFLKRKIKKDLCLLCEHDFDKRIEELNSNIKLIEESLK